MKLENNAERHTDKLQSEIVRLMHLIQSAIKIKDYTAAKRIIRKLERYSTIVALEQSIVLEIERKNFAAAEKEFRKFRSLAKDRPVYQSYLEARALIAQSRHIEALKVLKIADASNNETDKRILHNFYIAFSQCCSFLGIVKKFLEVSLKLHESAQTLDQVVGSYGQYLYVLHFLPFSIAEQRKAAERFQTFFSQVKQISHPKPTRKKEKLRIGYISPDLRSHVVLRFSYVFFCKYDHERFEVYVYANNKEDLFSKYLTTIVDNWHNITGKNAAEIAEIIHKDKIDILVDLAGHTRDNCLTVLAYKPAPIQISGIGYWASTGLKAIDYFLGDKYLDTDEAKQGFTEELIVLPNSHFCFAEPPENTTIEELPYNRNGYITFGCFSIFSKINDEVLKAWAKIMQQVPNSKLLLKGKIFDTEDSREFAAGRIIEAGIPLERVEMRCYGGDYMNQYNDMDISLDTFPYPGGGTSCDALYMSVPLITLRGKSHGERFGASILENLGLGELCADTVDEYVEIAVKLANDIEYLEKLHSTLRQTMMDSPVMDADLYMKNVEDAYETVWNRYVEQRWQED